jgi:seryl-tRNA synthetase
MRVHQFYKTEQIVFCIPEDSEEWHQRTLANEEWILKELGIPYQVVLTAVKDLAPFGNIKYDLEAWIPSQDKFREMTSNTNLLDYQTRRSNIRANDKTQKRKFFPHTISATGFPDRLMIAIMENYQSPDGSIEIPEKLRPYMRGLAEIKK